MLDGERTFIDLLRHDCERSKGNIKSLIIIVLFRFAYACHEWRKRNFLIWIFLVPYLVFYRVFVEWILGIEIPHKTRIGGGLRIEHGFGIVINDHAVIGRNLLIRNGVTIGTKIDYGPSPVIGDNVWIGSNSLILGGIHIGNNVIIGAGSVVIDDVPDNVIIVGNPARIVRKND